MIMVYELKPLLNLEVYHEYVLYITIIMSLLNKTNGITLLETQRNDGNLEHEEKWNNIELHIGWLTSCEINQLFHILDNLERVIENKCNGYKALFGYDQSSMVIDYGNVEML